MIRQPGRGFNLGFDRQGTIEDNEGHEEVVGSGITD